VDVIGEMLGGGKHPLKPLAARARSTGAIDALCLMYTTTKYTKEAMFFLGGGLWWPPLGLAPVSPVVIDDFADRPRHVPAPHEGGQKADRDTVPPMR
jgi:hypothetical protein